jgi:hypothetical protein
MELSIFEKTRTNQAVRFGGVKGTPARRGGWKRKRGKEKGEDPSRDERWPDPLPRGRRRPGRSDGAGSAWRRAWRGQRRWRSPGGGGASSAGGLHPSPHAGGGGGFRKPGGASPARAAAAAASPLVVLVPSCRSLRKDGWRVFGTFLTSTSHK